MDALREVCCTSPFVCALKRAFLALALAQNPKVLMLDEPTTYLDLSYQLQLLELLKQLKQHQKLAIITVLHDVNLAARYSDRLTLLYQGVRGIRSFLEGYLLPMKLAINPTFAG